MTAHARRRAEAEIARLCALEAHYSAVKRAHSPAALVQAAEIRRIRERAELALDCPPATIQSLPLFEEC